jgi:hypothetical protein
VLIVWFDAEEGTLEIVASAELPGHTVTSVLASGRWIAALTARADGDAEGLGSVLHALQVGGDSSTPEATVALLGKPIDTPAPIVAPPVLASYVEVCDAQTCAQREGVLASGGSHWLALYRAETGDVVWEATDLPERVTGLAVGGDGVIYSGGSHWLGGGEGGPGWTARAIALHPPGSSEGEATATWLAGSDAAVVDSVPSPLVEGGFVAFAIVPKVGTPTHETVETGGAGQHVCGWPRAHGDLGNRSSHVTFDYELCAPPF